MISLSGAVSVIVTLVVAGLIFWMLWFLLDYVGLPQPFNKVARVVLMLLAVLVVIGVLLQLVGGQAIFKASLEAPLITETRG